MWRRRLHPPLFRPAVPAEREVPPVRMAGLANYCRPPRPKHRMAMAETPARRRREGLAAMARRRHLVPRGRCLAARSVSCPPRSPSPGRRAWTGRPGPFSDRRAASPRGCRREGPRPYQAWRPRAPQQPACRRCSQNRGRSQARRSPWPRRIASCAVCPSNSANPSARAVEQRRTPRFVTAVMDRLGG